MRLGVEYLKCFFFNYKTPTQSNTMWIKRKLVPCTNINHIMTLASIPMHPHTPPRTKGTVE